VVQEFFHHNGTTTRRKAGAGNQASLPVSQTLPPGVFRQLAKALCVLRVAPLQAGKYRRDIVLILATASGRIVDWKGWGVLPVVPDFVRTGVVAARTSPHPKIAGGSTATHS